jgi:uncharacterized protein (TIGR03067 family)
MTALTTLALAAGLLTAAEPPAADARAQEEQRLQGTWTATAVEITGMVLPNDFDLRLVFKGNVATFHLNGNVILAATARLEPEFTTKLIDLTFTQGEQKGQTWAGIYRLEGDTFTLCLMLREKERPSEFASRADSNTALVVFKRER